VDILIIKRIWLLSTRPTVQHANHGTVVCL